MKRNPLTLVVGGALVVLFLLVLVVFQVRETEVAVVTTFGKMSREITQPGQYWKWPWPMQKVEHFDSRIHNLESPFEQIQTSDNYSLLVMTYAGWKISDPKVFFPRFGGSMAKAEEGLSGLMRNAYSGVVGEHPLAHFVSTSEKELQFVEIEKQILQRLKKEVQESNYGLEIQFLGIKKLGLPESVTEKVFDEMRSKRQILERSIRDAADNEASKIRSTADTDSARMLTEADAKAKKIISEGEREAAQYFDTFKREPALASFLLKLSGLEAFLKERTTLVLDLNSSPLDLMKSSPDAPTKPEPAGKATSN
jgi:modulator of FtsH protease HflC